MTKDDGPRESSRWSMRLAILGMSDSYLLPESVRWPSHPGFWPKDEHRWLLPARPKAPRYLPSRNS
jgi:hypothetical protein